VRQAQEIFALDTRGRGFVDITDLAATFVAGAGMTTGLLTLFCRHTSASLAIQENADPAVLRDLMAWLERMAPEGPHYEHDDEGPDDMPAHLRSVLTQTSLTIPIVGGRLALGTWQAIYLIEHRRRPHRREIVAHAMGE
jgi:secondary thiamine-phosphate synthase enzyme